MRKWKRWAGIIFTVLFLTSCTHEVMIRPGDSFPVAFNKAVTMFQNEHYDDAAKAFQTVITSGRGTKWAKNSQYFLAQSYYKSSQYLLAANAYQQFIALYPKSTQSMMASYKKGLCYYKLSPRYAVDQSNTHKAINSSTFSLPNTPNLIW
jgi:outer membrane protein assembly factor BamD